MGAGARDGRRHAGAAPHRAGRRDRARRARGDGRGRVRPAARASRAASGRSGCRRAGGWNGRTARWRRCFSAEDPESLRGPQFAAAWCDELAKWRHAEATFDMLQFGLRLGERPRQVITTTPRPIALIKRLIADPRDRGDARRAPRPTRCNLAPAFLDAVVGALRRHAARPPGDRRRDRRGARRRAVDARRDRGLPRRGGAAACSASWSRSIRRPRPGKGADACGLVAAGRRRGRHDLSCSPTRPRGGLSPAGWARKAIALWRRLYGRCAGGRAFAG